MPSETGARPCFSHRRAMPPDRTIAGSGSNSRWPRGRGATEDRRLVGGLRAGVEPLAVDRRRTPRSHSEPDDGFEQLAALADPLDERPRRQGVIGDPGCNFDSRQRETPRKAQGARERRNPAFGGGDPAAVLGPPGWVEPYRVGVGELGREAVSARHFRLRRIRGRVQGRHGVRFDRRNVESRERERERVGADAAAEVDDPPRSRLDETRRVQGSDAQPGRLLVSVCGEEHRARALAELGRGPRSQARQRERGRRLVGVQPLAPQPCSEGEDVV